MANEPVAKLNLLVDGKAVRLSQQYSIEFRPNDDPVGEPIPELFFRCKKVTKAWTLRAYIYQPGVS